MDDINGNNSVTINRDELYEQVWNEPTIKLAPKYGISNVGLKKICKKLNVPTPPRGYWAKIQNNIRVEKTPLPKIKHGEQSTYTIQKNGKFHEDDPDLSDEANQIIAAFESVEQINVPERLNSPHPLVRMTRNALSSGKSDEYGVLYKWPQKHLDIRVSPNILNRALRIMDGILRFFEKQGYEVSIGDGQQSPTGTYIKILGEKVQIYIHERSNRQDHVLTEKEKQELKRGYGFFIKKYDYIPSGKLNLHIENWGARGVRQRWSDGKKQRIENILKDFVICIVKVADLRRTARIEREEQERRRAEERRRQAEMERLRQIEEERLRDFENQATLWFKSSQLREYIKAVENASAERGFFINDEPFKSWLNWAKNHANSIDPLYNNLPFENKT